MTEKLDAIIFGATGFTGKVVVKDSVELLKDFTWGIAGRNKQKLEDILKEIGDEIKINLSHIPVIIADTGDEKSLKDMAKKCKILLNCCGSVEQVVNACIEAGTHYVDISGSTDKIELQYHDLAKEKNVYVIAACAFLSIPADLGVVFAERNFEGTINSIDSYIDITVEQKDPNSKAILHHGTWESFLTIANNLRKFSRLNKQINDQFEIPELRPKLSMKLYIQKPNFGNSYFIPMPFGDRNVVKRSQLRLYKFEKKRPIQFESYIGFHSLFWPIILPLYMPILLIMALMPCCNKLLLNHPKFFTFGRLSHEGPSVANQNGVKFQITFKATGWSKDQALSLRPDKIQLTRVSGVCPFYGFTSVALIMAAKTILTESDKMPESGGVLPPAAAFYKTNLIEELSKHKNGIKFEVLK